MEWSIGKAFWWIGFVCCISRTPGYQEFIPQVDLPEFKQWTVVLSHRIVNYPVNSDIIVNHRTLLSGSDPTKIQILWTNNWTCAQEINTHLQERNNTEDINMDNINDMDYCNGMICGNISTLSNVTTCIKLSVEANHTVRLTNDLLYATVTFKPGSESVGPVIWLMIVSCDNCPSNVCDHCDYVQIPYVLNAYRKIHIPHAVFKRVDELQYPVTIMIAKFHVSFYHRDKYNIPKYAEQHNISSIGANMTIKYKCFINQTAVNFDIISPIQLKYDVSPIMGSYGDIRVVAYIQYKHKMYGSLFCIIKILDIYKKMVLRFRSNTIVCCSPSDTSKQYEDYFLEKTDKSLLTYVDTVAFYASKVDPITDEVYDMKIKGNDRILINNTLISVIGVIALMIVTCIIIVCCTTLNGRLKRARQNNRMVLDRLTLFDNEEGHLRVPVKFDVFLSHSSCEETFVEKTLLHKLENKLGYKCCFHRRDFARV